MLPVAGDTAVLERLAGDGDWFCSPKLDGDRALVQCGDNAAVLNRGGVPYTKRVSKDLLKAVAWLPDDMVLDGELVDGRLYLFDVVISRTPLWQRLEVCDRVQSAVAALSKWQPPVVGVPHVRASDDKHAMVRQVEAAGGEGVVFKKAASAYHQGRSDRWVKVKFRISVDAVVIERGVDKEHLSVGVWRDGVLVEIAHVSALTGDGACAQPGDVVTVTALQVTDNGRLREPTRPVLRDDKPASECTWDQLGALRR